MTIGETILRVLQICLPIFAMIGFGAWLRRIGWLDDAARAFLNRFLYHFALPVLVFFGVAEQDFHDILDLAIFTGVIGTVIIGGAVFFLTAHLAGLRGGERAVVTNAVHWGNVSYLGFPLAKAAFGAEGFAYACIVNACGMPVMVILGIFVLSMASEQKLSFGRQCRQAFGSPVVLAAVAGVLASLVLNEFGLGSWLQAHEGVTRTLLIGRTFFDMLGEVGLPLALIAVGSALRMDYVRGRVGLMCFGSLGKLVLGPLLSLGILTLGTTLGWWDQPAPAALGATVLLMATPAAVAAYVVSDQLGVEPEVNAGLMVLSTLLSCLTIPVWVALLI